MKTGYDPRKPRRNPALAEWERLVRGGSRDFRQAKTHAEKRGHAVVLQAKLEAFLDEPEEIADLLPGAVEPTLKSPFNEAELRDATWPFAENPPPGAEFFYYTYGGGITPLLTAEQCKRVDPRSLSAYWVLRLRRLHLTDAPTKMHLAGSEALERCKPSFKRYDIWNEPIHMVLLDPAGLDGGRIAPLVYQSLSAARALAKGEALAEWLEIRCLIARLEGAIHTH